MSEQYTDEKKRVLDQWRRLGSVDADEVPTLVDVLQDRYDEAEILLRDCEEYFDQRADIAEYSDETGHTPNEEMKMLNDIRAFLNTRKGG